MSDLHVEVAPLDPPLLVPDADVCVVAGDLSRGVTRSIGYMADLLGGRMPGILVAGNHEYWGSSIEQEIGEGRMSASDRQGIHFLQDECVMIDGVRFVGATLWTDFALHDFPRLAKLEVRERMRDYKRICLAKNPWTRFTPEVSTRLHAESRSFIETAAGNTDKSVIVTHHAPHPKSLAYGTGGPMIDAAYASNLECLIETLKPTAWIHGHTHLRRNYVVGATRVVSNPCGYPHERGSFDRGFIIEI